LLDFKVVKLNILGKPVFTSRAKFRSQTHKSLSSIKKTRIHDIMTAKTQTLIKMSGKSTK